MFAAPPHGDDCVITSFPCSAISLQRSLCPQYDSCVVDDDDDDGGDDISSQWSMSPGPPTPRSITSLQGSLSPQHDCITVSSVNGGCDDGNVTASQSPFEFRSPTSLSVATAAQHSRDWFSSCWDILRYMPISVESQPDRSFMAKKLSFDVKITKIGPANLQIICLREIIKKEDKKRKKERN